MKKIQLFSALFYLGMAGTAFFCLASPSGGFDWLTGQGLVDTLNV